MNLCGCGRARYNPALARARPGVVRPSPHLIFFQISTEPQKSARSPFSYPRVQYPRTNRAGRKRHNSTVRADANHFRSIYATVARKFHGSLSSFCLFLT